MLSLLGLRRQFGESRRISALMMNDLRPKGSPMALATAITALIFTAFWPASQGRAAGAEHVVIIGCDGMGSVAFLPQTNAPVMRRLMREGAWTLHARGVMPTSSSPNWASMIMGAGPEQHGVTSNDWETNKFEIAPVVVGTDNKFPTIFGVLRQQRPAVTILCVHDWDGFGRLLERNAVDVIENVKGSPATAKRACELIKQITPAFTFIHFDDVDHAGHHDGWKSPSYYQAVDMVDGLIGEVLATIDQTSMKDHTIVLITADHGGRQKSHGEATMEELEIPWLIHGPGVFPGKQIVASVNTYDTAPTIAWIFHLTPPECWIGKPVLSAFVKN